MKEIPCIICFELSESKEKTAIAKVCDNCKTSDLNKVLKNLNYKTVIEAIQKSNKNLKITEDGEIV